MMESEQRYIPPDEDSLGDAQREAESESPVVFEQRAVEPRLAGILRGATEHAIIVTDCTGIITLFNVGAERMLGYSATEVVGTCTQLLLHDPAEIAAHAAERSLATSSEVLIAAARRHEAETREWTYVRKDRSRLTVLVTITGLWDEQNSLSGFMAIAHDITERKRTEEALRASELQFRSAVQLATNAIISADDRGSILSWNKGARRMFGYSTDHVLGQNLTMLIPERLRDAHQQGLHRATVTGTVHHTDHPIELCGLRKDSTEFPMELSLTSWTISDRRFYGGIIRDTTERKRAEEQRAELLARERAARAEAETNAEMVLRIQAISDTALAHLTLEDLLPRLLDRLCAALGVDTVSVLLIEGDNLVAWASRGLEEEVEQGIRIPLGHGLAGRIAAERRTLIVDDVLQYDLYLPRVGQIQIRSMLGTPLLLNGEVIGVVDVGTLHPHRFTEHDARLLELAATRVAVAIDRARLHEAERAAHAAAETALGRLGFLAEAANQFTTSLDYGITLQRVADLAVPVLADACIVEISVDDASFHQIAVAHVDAAKMNLLRELRRFPLVMRDLNPIAGTVLSTGQPYISSDLSDTFLMSLARDPEHLQMLRALSLTSAIIVPLIVREQTLGVMSLFSTQPRRRYGPADLTMAQALADRAALAVDNARLYREAQERLRREQTARADAERLAAERAAILGQIAAGVVIADTAGRLTFANEAAQHHYGIQTLGVSIEEDPWIHHVSRGDGRPWSPDELPLVRAVARGETVIGAEICIQQPGRQDIVALVSAAPVIAPGGAKLGAVLVLHDVSAQRELDRQKDEFFANMSHDLRTPLAAIMTSIGVVLANEPPDIPVPLHRMLVNIEHAADHMAELVENLLELTRMQTGRARLRLDHCDLRELAVRMAGAIEPLAQARSQRVELDLPPDPVVALVDSQRLERALLNLLSNAHKYGRTGGVIRIRLERRLDEVAFAVMDDGPGILAADRHHLFERYYRSNAEASRRNQGSGLGLPITRAMVELHRGRLSVDSTPGAGATFWIVLPTDPPATALGKEGAG
jgi:PAS domain S-box-containing protein